MTEVESGMFDFCSTKILFPIKLVSLNVTEVMCEMVIQLQMTTSTLQNTKSVLLQLVKDHWTT